MQHKVNENPGPVKWHEQVAMETMRIMESPRNLALFVVDLMQRSHSAQKKIGEWDPVVELTLFFEDVVVPWMDHGPTAASEVAEGINDFYEGWAEDEFFAGCFADIAHSANCGLGNSGEWKIRARGIELLIYLGTTFAEQKFIDMQEKYAQSSDNEK